MIPQFIYEVLTNDYIKIFLKRKEIAFNESDNKEQLKIKLIDAKNSGVISEKEWNVFLAEVFKYGSNRIILCNQVEIDYTNAIKTKKTLESFLLSKGEPSGYYNIVDEIEGDESLSRDVLLYQNITYSNNSTRLFERAYYRTEKKAVTDENGETIILYVKIVTWVLIDIECGEIRIHTKDLLPNHFGNNYSLRNTNNKYLSKINKIFNFKVNKTTNHKRTLYNLYKEMTETAEAPFKEKINEGVQEAIDTLVENISKEIGYNIDNDNLKIASRIARLFERGLITQEYDIYSMYSEGKIGIIKRIIFDDNTGANVSAMVRELDDNISSYDIYFDTRDTLDKKQALNKLWAYWYFCGCLEKKEEKYEVKIEVMEDYYIIHFLRRSILEEVVNHVFSKLREFTF